jgi:predicted metal-binding membrane protein
MIDQALGVGLKRGVTGTLAKSALFLVLVPATALSVMIAAGLAVIVLSGQTHSVGEARPYVIGFLLFAVMTWYLVRLMIRERRS